jgi:hypothetical protein
LPTADGAADDDRVEVSGVVATPDRGRSYQYFEETRDTHREDEDEDVLLQTQQRSADGKRQLLVDLGSEGNPQSSSAATEEYSDHAEYEHDDEQDDRYRRSLHDIAHSRRDYDSPPSPPPRVHNISAGGHGNSRSSGGDRSASGSGSGRRRELDGRRSFVGEYGRLMSWQADSTDFAWHGDQNRPKRVLRTFLRQDHLPTSKLSSLHTRYHRLWILWKPHRLFISTTHCPSPDHLEHRVALSGPPPHSLSSSPARPTPLRALYPNRR